MSSTKILIKKTIETEVEVEVEFPVYRKMGSSYCKLESEGNYLTVQNGPYIKTLQVVTGLTETFKSILNDQESTEEEFEKNRAEVIDYLKDAFVSPVPSQVFDRNEHISEAINDYRLQNHY